jgi:transcriptional regulator with XRE-family HTH domain
MTEFGDELRRLLAQRGISLSAAAREAGCSKDYLSNAANGRKALTPRTPLNNRDLVDGLVAG